MRLRTIYHGLMLKVRLAGLVRNHTRDMREYTAKQLIFSDWYRQFIQHSDSIKVRTNQVWTWVTWLLHHVHTNTTDMIRKAMKDSKRLKYFIWRKWMKNVGVYYDWFLFFTLSCLRDKIPPRMGTSPHYFLVRMFIQP